MIPRLASRALDICRINDLRNWVLPVPRSPTTPMFNWLSRVSDMFRDSDRGSKPSTVLPTERMIPVPGSSVGGAGLAWFRYAGRCLIDQTGGCPGDIFCWDYYGVARLDIVRGSDVGLHDWGAGRTCLAG